MSFTFRCLKDAAPSDPAPAATATTATKPRPTTPGNPQSVAEVANGAVATPAPFACATCASLRPAPGKQPDGWCEKFKTETFGQFTGGCPDGWTPADPAARELARRRARVVDDLTAHPEARYSFQVAGASPSGPGSSAVSVVLGIHMKAMSIIVCELVVPADRWPGLAIFIGHWRLAAEGKPS